MRPLQTSCIVASRRLERSSEFSSVASFVNARSGRGRTALNLVLDAEVARILVQHMFALQYRYP